MVIHVDTPPNNSDITFAWKKKVTQNTGFFPSLECGPVLMVIHPSKSGRKAFNKSPTKDGSFSKEQITNKITTFQIGRSFGRSQDLGQPQPLPKWLTLLKFNMEPILPDVKLGLSRPLLVAACRSFVEREYELFWMSRWQVGSLVSKRDILGF